MSPGDLAGSALALLVFVLLLAPAGYWLLWRVGGAEPRVGDLGPALAVGYSVVLPLLWAERMLGAPVLVLPVTLLSVIALRARWRRFHEGWPGLVFLAVPLALGLLASVVDGGDVRLDSAGASFRLGFDVSDRAFYSLVSQELERSPPPAMQNPLFGGVPFAYSFFPALAGLLLRLYGGLDGLRVFALHLPVVSFVFIGLASDALLRDWGIASRTARALTPLLCVLGGDLSALFPARGILGAERTAHFLAFSSFSAESLYYNPWMLGFPLVLAALVLAGRWLRGEGRGWLWLAAWVLATLWQSKLFACAPLVAAAAVAAIVRRDRRLASLALLAGAMALPWIGLTLASSGGGLRPFVFAPLQPVRLALAAHPSWDALASIVDGGRPWPVQALALAASTVLVVCGGFAARLLGAAGLARRMRQDASGLATWIGLACAIATLLGFTVAGDPVPLDGVQFLILPQLLLWTTTGPLLARWLEAPGLRRWGAVLLVPLACASPAGYVLRKVAPERFTSPRSMDRYRLALAGDDLAAAAWLARQPLPRANLAVDWRPTTSDPAGRRPFYAAALSSRRLCAFVETFSVPARVADERRRLVAELYDTTDSARAESLLDALHADWVWVDSARPLRFDARGLRLRFRAGAAEVYERVASTP